MYGAQAALGAHEQMREVFFPDGHLLEQGERVVQHRAGRTLQRLADEGDAYYLGDFARAFVAENRRGGGVIVQEDLDRAAPLWAEPVTGRYRGLDLIASAPPDDGGQMLAEALAMLDHVDLGAMGRPTEDVRTLALLADVHNEVYYAPARRGGRFENPEHLAFLRSPEHAADRLAVLGRPPAVVPTPTPGTIHVSAVDGAGNVASLTHSHMASGWVNGLFAEGFQLAGGGSFFQRGMPDPGAKAAVHLAPHVVLRDGSPVLVGGSPSVSLVANVIQNVVNIVDFGMSIEESVRAPRFGARPHDPDRGWVPGVVLEAGFDESVRAAYLDQARAQRLWAWVVSPWYPLTGNYEGITIDLDGVAAASADPRRVGSAEAV